MPSSSALQKKRGGYKTELEKNRMLQLKDMGYSFRYIGAVSNTPFTAVVYHIHSQREKLKKEQLKASESAAKAVKDQDEREARKRELQVKIEEESKRQQQQHRRELSESTTAKKGTKRAGPVAGVSNAKDDYANDEDDKAVGEEDGDEEDEDAKVAEDYNESKERKYVSRKSSISTKRKRFRVDSDDEEHKKCADIHEKHEETKGPNLKRRSVGPPNKNFGFQEHSSELPVASGTGSQPSIILHPDHPQTREHEEVKKGIKRTLADIVSRNIEQGSRARTAAVVAAVNLRGGSSNPLLSEMLMNARLKWAETHLESGRAEWNRVVWTDFSSIEVYKNSYRKWSFKRHTGIQPSTVERSSKLTQCIFPVWIAFAPWGRTEMVSSQAQNITHEGYEDLLRQHLVPLIAGHEKLVIIRDHLPFPFHNSNVIRSREHEMMTLPNRSPDLDPFENIWDLIAEEFSVRLPAATHKTFNKIQAYTFFLPIFRSIWRELPAEIFSEVYSSMRARCEAVIESRGGMSKFCTDERRYLPTRNIFRTLK